MTDLHLQYPPVFIKLLAHDLRWRLLKALTLADYRVHELVTRVDQPMNLVSYHLKKLRDAQLVTTRRSEADGRDTYYSLDLDQLWQCYAAVGQALHPAFNLSNPPQPQTLSAAQAQPAPQRILFICTHNSARSQMAQGLMQALGGDAVRVYSAGSHPTRIHPDAMAVMDQHGIDIRGQSPHHLSAYEGQTFDVVITVCDRARELCPAFTGGGVQIHWGFADPTVISDDEERLRAFMTIAERLKTRVGYFMKHILYEEN